MTEEALSARAESVCRVMAQVVDSGLCRTGGNASARIDSSAFVVSPAGAVADYLGRLRPEQLHTIAVGAGSIPEGASSETVVHEALYRTLPSVGGIVHVHSAYTLALGDDVSEWPSLTVSSEWFTGSIISLSRGLGPRQVAAAVEGLQAVAREAYNSRYGLCLFVPRHGIFACSRSVERALYFANKVEENAKIASLKPVSTGAVRWPS